MRLEGKVALVTGATYGIGAVIVERLAEEGAAVLFTGRSADMGAAGEERLRARELQVTYCRGDAADEADVRRAVDTAVATYGSLTTVVNNAAATDVTRPGGGDSHVTEIENAAFDAVWHVGVHGVLWTSKYAIPHLQAAGGGAIVNISAASSLRAIEGRPAYQASKGAVNALTRQIAVDYGRYGIRCNAIAVGFTPTGGEVMTKMLRNEAFMAGVRTAIPSHRLGDPVDIANGCVYLASDEGEYVNGVVLPIDGGFTAKLAIPDTSSLVVLQEP
jgi:meso-butanediol dehydrogenase / (S,S)-butanediol dehydrogenase / diacetyl reductase